MLSAEFTLPPEVRDASVWYGPEVAGQTDWLVPLTETEIAEVESAVHKLEESHLRQPVDLIPLPTLAPRLKGGERKCGANC